MQRRLELSEGTSDKFWEVEVSGSDVTVSFGRRGTAGQTKTKTWADPATALAEATRLVGEKLRKGYSDAGGSAAAPAAAVAVAPARRASPTPAAAVAAAPARRASPTPAAGTASGRRPSPTPTAAAPPAAAPVPPAAPAPAPTPAAAVRTAAPARAAAGSRPHVDLTAAELSLNAAHPLLPHPGEPRPFDREALLAQLRGCTAYDYSRWRPKAPFPAVVTADEAAWWLTSTQVRYPDSTPKKAAERMASMPPPSPRQAASHWLAVVRGGRSTLGEAFSLVCLAALLGADETLAWLTAVKTPHPQQPAWQDRSDSRTPLIEESRRALMPLCTPAGLDAARTEARRQLTGAVWTTGGYLGVATAFGIGAQLGLTAEVAALVRSLPDKAFGGPENYSGHYARPQTVVLALADAGLAAHEAARVQVPVQSAWDVTAYLAATGDTALGYLADQLAGITEKERAAEAVEVAVRVLHGPAAAPLFARLLVDGKATSLAGAWFADHARSAVLGAGHLVGRPGRAAEALLAALRRGARLDPAGLEDGLADLTLTDEVAARSVRARLEAARAGEDLPALDEAPGWWPATKAKALPDWLGVDDLPPLVVDGHRLGADLLRQLLTAATASTLEAPAPLVAAVRERVTPTSRDPFALAVLRAWLAEGGPSKAKWAFVTVGLLGGDATALELEPLVRAWPGESQHQRAVLGLGVLGAIGTDTALQVVSGIGEKIKFRALQQKARETIDELAKARGLSKDELEDRIIPTAGLDEETGRVVDLGGRSLAVSVVGGKPVLRLVDGDGRPSGKPRADLPAKVAADDPAAYDAAKSGWKLLKKQVTAVATVQAARLEGAMVVGRRWSVDEHRTLLVDHPLVGQLVTALVWGAWDRSSDLVATFRVTDERDLADVEDALLEPDPEWRLGIVHPLQLDAATSGAWGEILADYELVPPFPQLGRPVYEATQAELAATEITRFKDVKIAASTFVGTLEKLGWLRGPAQDAGIFSEHAKPFYGQDVTAVVTYYGVPMGYMVDWDDQSPDAVFVVPGIYLGGGSYVYPDHTERFRFVDLDPVVVSEVLADLHALADKARP